MDKADTPVKRGQILQNGLIKHKTAIDLVAVLHGTAERRVVVQSQVTSEPDQHRGKMCEMSVHLLQP